MKKQTGRKADKDHTPSMLSLSAEEKERLSLVLSGLRDSAKQKNAPKGLAELVRIASDAKRMAESVAKGQWAQLDPAAKQSENRALYASVCEAEYETSILNPDVAARAYGTTYAQVIAMLGRELFETVPYLMRGIEKPYLYVCELIAEIFGHIEKDGVDRGIKQSLYYYAHDYFREYTELRMYEKYDPSSSKAVEEIIRRAAEDEGCLYDYGVPVSEEAIAVHRFLAKQPKKTIDGMAKTFVNGFIDSFETMRIDRSKKNSVAFDTYIGFERVTARAAELFREAGLEPRLFLQSALLVNILNFQIGGIGGNSVNRQYSYDHRNNGFLVLQRPIIEEAVTSMRECLEVYKEPLAGFAGPAVQEIFGEPDVEYVNKRAVPTAKPRTAAFLQELRGRIVPIIQQYIKPEERTFTIIAYPVPSVGKNFTEVFRETIRCNTLSNAHYKEIQQKIIDVLDKGAYVTVSGRGANETNMKVMLHTLTDPAKQTNFENCGADVNIPVGEVFTSPVLAGTEGTLHVTKVCIDGVTFKNLRFTFKDGMITSYMCDNFPTDNENRTFLEEAILAQHKTLPIGEFAIGTNTVAYAMGIRCDVQEKLPILIAEKTGPHFAVGDTCYSHSEDHALYNPDGKEIIARENEVSALRDTDPAKAYMNCHTDITIPYDELGEILVHDAKGRVIGAIIRNGRFVVPGTEELNEPLEELEKADK